MRKKSKQTDVKRFNALIGKIVADCLNDPSLPEAGIHYARLLSQGFHEVEVIQLVGSTLVSHLYLAEKTGIPLDPVQLRLDLSKLPNCGLFENDESVDLSLFFKR